MSNLSARLLPDPESGAIHPIDTKASRSLTRLRRVIGTLSLLDSALIITLTVAGRQSPDSHDGSYNYRSTVEDLVAMSGLRMAIVFTMLVTSMCYSSNVDSDIEDLDLDGERALSGEGAVAARNGVQQSRDGGLPMWIAFYVMIISSILTAGKAISFFWTTTPQLFSVALVLALVISFVQVYLIDKYVGASEAVRKERDDIGQAEADDIAAVLTDTSDAEKKHLSSRSLLHVLKPYFWPTGTLNKLRCISTWIALGISKVTGLASPIFIGRAVEALRNDSSLELVYWNLALFAGSALASKVFKELQNVIYLRVKQVAYTEIAQETFAHIHALSLDWHLKKKMGNVLRSMDRGVNASNTVVTYLLLYLGPTIAECIAVFIIFYLHFSLPLLSSATFVAFGLYALCTVRITLWRKKFRKATNKHDNAFHDKATDSLINFETVKYFTTEGFEVQRYVQSVQQFQKSAVSTQLSLSLLNVSQQTIIGVCSAVALCIAAQEVRTGNTLKIGDFVSVNMYIVQLFAPLTFLGSVYNAIIQAFIDMSNLSELLAEEPDIIDAPDSKVLVADVDGKGASVEYRNVYFNYPTQLPNAGLQNVSFFMAPGTVTAVVGKTGAGKTSISRLLFRFYDPLSGQVLVSGQDITKVSQSSLRSAIGVVPQDVVLFNDTIRYNILYGKLPLLRSALSPTCTAAEREASEVALRKACSEAQILDFIDNLPFGFNTKVGERGLRLSGGEKQRVSIARALLKNAPIVVLDEATSALDSRTERSVQDALNSLTLTRTTLVIAHRLSTIRKADQIIVLDQGKVMEIGAFDNLMSKEGTFHAMWVAQLEDAKEGEKEMA